MKNGQQPAFPDPQSYDKGVNGLTKREYFAAMAMQGLISKEGEVDHESRSDKYTSTYQEKLIRKAVSYADELLKQLEA